MKNPANQTLSDRTYHRLEGLVLNEYKEHGAEGLKNLQGAINDSFVKAQKEGGLQGPPNTFQFGNRAGDFIDGQIVDGKHKNHHIDFGFGLK